MDDPVVSSNNKAIIEKIVLGYVILDTQTKHHHREQTTEVREGIPVCFVVSTSSTRCEARCSLCCTGCTTVENHPRILIGL
jgi:hypothetical protein